MTARGGGTGGGTSPRGAATGTRASPRHVLRSTWSRLTALSVAVLATSLASTVVIAWELALLQGGDNLDRAMQRELEVFSATAPGLLAGTGPDDTAEIAQRLRDYLATQPGTDQTFTTIEVSGQRRASTTAGPAAIVTLLDQDRLPEGTVGRVVTVDTAAGRVRVLTSPVEMDGVQVGTYTVFGWLGGVDEEAALVAQRTSLAAAIVGVLGIAALAVAFRSATAPLRALHDTAERAGLADLAVRVPDPGDETDDVAGLARAFNRMLERIEAESSARTALFASVSHELRTPVAVARGHLELLSSGAARDPEASLRLVTDELARLSRLLDDLLLLSAAEAGAGTFLAPRLVERGWFASEVQLRLVGLGMADVPVDVLPDGDPGEQLHVDPDRLLQAVVNLAVNARRHTPPGTAVRLSVGGGPGELAVTVSDDGPGIPEDLRDRVLEPFVGGGGRGSTGLGLAVVHAVVRAHGGTLAVDTGDDGTVATVSVPSLGDGAAGRSA